MSELFPITSRYCGIGTREIETADGRTHMFLRRRFLPPSGSLELLELHTVVEGERLDHIAGAHLGDPEQFWRICDANDAMRPEELTRTPGRKLRITLPAGVSGPVL